MAFENITHKRCLLCKEIKPVADFTAVKSIKSSPDGFSARCKPCKKFYNVKPKSLEYRIWSEAKQRCHNPHNKRYPYYGGRGITMCAAWRESFETFLADMGSRPAGFSIERIDNDGHYEKNNCKWASRREQGRNKRSNVIVAHNGEVLTLIEWAERTGIPYKTLHNRFTTHGTAGLFEPIQSQYSRHR